MENKINKEIFKTNLSSLETFLVVIQLILGVLGSAYFASSFTRDDWGAQLFILCFFIFWIIQVIRGAKTFHLFSDKLIIKRPFAFTQMTNVVFMAADIKEVIFKKINGRFGGPYILIKSKRINEAYRINFSNSVLDNFITHLQELGIKSSKENFDS